MNGRTWWPRRLAEAILGKKNCKGFNIHISHPLIHLPPTPYPHPPKMEFISFIEGTETSSAEGSFRMESAEFSTSPLPLTPFYPEPGISKTPKVLTLFSHWLSLTIVGGDSREVCMNFSKPFFWFKQKAKEVKESVWCTNTDYDSPLRHVLASRLSLFEATASIIKSPSALQSCFLSEGQDDTLRTDQT